MGGGGGLGEKADGFGLERRGAAKTHGGRSVGLKYNTTKVVVKAPDQRRETHRKSSNTGKFSTIT